MTQIVIGGPQKTRLGLIGRTGIVPCLLQFTLIPLGQCYVPESRDYSAVWQGPAIDYVGRTITEHVLTRPAIPMGLQFPGNPGGFRFPLNQQTGFDQSRQKFGKAKSARKMDAVDAKPLPECAV